MVQKYLKIQNIFLFRFFQNIGRPHGEFFLIEVAEAQYHWHTGYRLCPERLTGFRRYATLTVTRRNQPKDVMLPILPRPLVGAGRIRKEREIQVHTQKAVFENGLVCVPLRFSLCIELSFRPQRILRFFCLPSPSVICIKCYFALSHNAKKTIAYRRNLLCVL